MLMARLGRTIALSAVSATALLAAGYAAHAGDSQSVTSSTHLVSYRSALTSSSLTQPAYAGTLVGPGLASMYPVDVSQDSQYYFVLDAGEYRVVAVNRMTGNIDCQVGGQQGTAASGCRIPATIDWSRSTPTGI